jgi:hypothetical protein
MWREGIIKRRRRNMRLHVSAWFIIAILGAPAVGLGQWIHYPTADVPKKADGTADLAAPAPRLPGGQPDFSGIWHTAVINQCEPATGRFCGNTEIGGSPLALNLGHDMPGGLPYQPWAAELVKQRFSKDDPHVRCLPDNPPRTWVMPHLTKALHTPRELVLLYEVNAMYRQIFIDGRPQPDDPTPTWNGYSTAVWEGDALVIQTKGFRDDLWIDMNGAPMTSSATMTERLRRTNYGTLEVELTVDDPKVYTRPWTVSLRQEIMLDTELIDEFCLENEKSWQHMQAPLPADLTGRWSSGGQNVFVLRHNGDALTGTIEGQPGEPTYKIVDGVIRGNQVHFFILHEDQNDPEVKANDGNPFHNFAKGTLTEDAIVVSGSRENTKIREYSLVLKRVGN